jgi:FtsZ-binding cell division protein ZapB
MEPQATSDPKSDADSDAETIALLTAEIARLKAQLDRLRAELRQSRRDQHETPPHYL